MANSNFLFPSEAPGLSRWERLRLRFCTIGLECRFTWIFMVTFAVYFMVVQSCALLLFRLMLQSILLGSCSFLVMTGYAVYVLQRNLNNCDQQATRQAKVIRTKTIPKEPMPQLPQKTFCWLEIADEDNDTVSIEKYDENHDIDVVNDKKESEDNLIDDDGEDDRDWLHVPCVIAQEIEASAAAMTRRIRKGDTLTVTFVDGDITRPVFLPYQVTVVKRMKSSFLWNIPWLASSLLMLHFLYEGIPVAFANSQALEDNLNAGFDAFAEWAAGFFPDDDDDAEEEEDDEPACLIPWFVAAGYDLLLLIQIAIPCGIFFYAKYKVHCGMEEPPANAYHVLRGDEEDDEVGTTTSDAPAAANGRPIVAKDDDKGSFTAVTV